MKKIQRYLIALVLSVTSFAGLNAQQVNTLYFLENTPVRHYMNPAIQPISKVYVSLPVIGYTSMWGGDYSGFGGVTMQDVIYKSYKGETITPLHPDGDKKKFLNTLSKSIFIGDDAQINLLSFGFRIKERGYFHFTLNEKMDGGVILPKSLYEFFLDGGMKDLDGVNSFNLKSFGADMALYTELGLGYSHEINEHWTVGGKLKVLMGQMYVAMSNKKFDMNLSTDEWVLTGNGNAYAALPVEALPETFDGNYFSNLELPSGTDMVMNLVKPKGWGGALDLGFTYKPISQLQISAAVTDLGFIYWNKGRKYSYDIDGVYEGAGDLKYADFKNEDDKFDSDRLMDTITTSLENTYKNMFHQTDASDGFVRMTNAKLNVGLDANFWDNRVGVGVYSRTKLFNKRLYEEVTLGAAFRPVHWFQIAASYSFINGHWSSMGAALGLVTYEGLGLTLAMDYIPFSYAAVSGKNVLPYKVPGVNFALGLNIVIGHSSDKDKDGVKDQYDQCPSTPKKVSVDEYGCPIDSDGDGVPDYLDQCPGTPAEAYGMVNEAGCPIDSDGDGVPDYLDWCPNTPKEAYGKVDEHGCALDSDGDGVPDYLDQCPDTPQEAWGYVDEHGCELDTDGDGVPDYLDKCPDTPAEAIGFLDENGCELDTDGDGVPDWRDECPNTPKEAWGYVDEHGCELDTDGDGVPDWCDNCPTVPGLKENKGCPAVKKEVRNLLKKAMQGIQFETGKATIKPVSYKILNDIAKVFTENPTWKVEVQGHTDNVGKPDFNLGLSDRRAQAVRKYLVEAGVPEKQLTARGYGDTKPIDTNKTAKGRAQNRRVEFDITFEEVTVTEVLDQVQDTTVTVQPIAPDSVVVAPQAATPVAE